MIKHLLIIFVLAGILCCKKKKEEKEPEPPTVGTPRRSNTMTARVNGINWAVKYNQTDSAKIEQSVSTGTGTPKQHIFIGRTGSSTYSNSIFFFTRYATGVVDLRSTPGSSAIYFDSNGQAYYINSGSMTITTMDTSHVKSDKCDKFKANFSFITDSIGGTGYSIDQGVIDFEAL